MKTRTTRLTLSHSEGTFEVEIIDEGTGEYVLVSCGLDRPPFEQQISIGPSEWPFLRDAIDRMFEEIAENESEGKLKKLLETPAPWEKASEEQAPPATAPQGAASGEADDWIPWNGGGCPVHGNAKVLVRFRDGKEDHDGDPAEWFLWHHISDHSDITAYKVVEEEEDEEPVDDYGNPLSGDRIINCCFPDCGCGSARVCMAEKGASWGATCLNIEKGSLK